MPLLILGGVLFPILIHSFDVRHVLVVPGLHWVVGATSVGLPELVPVLVTNTQAFLTVNVNVNDDIESSHS